MDAIEIVFDESVFSVDVIARTAHRYTDQFFVDLSKQSSGIHVRLIPKASSVDISDLVECFHNDALDDRLRSRIEAETTEIHGALVRAAMRGAQSDPVDPL